MRSVLTWRPKRDYGTDRVHAASFGGATGEATVRGGAIDYYGDDGIYLRVDDVASLRPTCDARTESSLRIAVVRSSEASDDPFVRGCEPATAWRRTETRVYAIERDAICLETIDSAGLGYGVHLDAWNRDARPVVRFRNGTRTTLRTYSTDLIWPGCRPAAPQNANPPFSRTDAYATSSVADTEYDGVSPLRTAPDEAGRLLAVSRVDRAAGVRGLGVVDAIDVPTFAWWIPGAVLDDEVVVDGTTENGLVAYAEWPFTIVARSIVDGVLGPEIVTTSSFCQPDIIRVSAHPPLAVVFRCGPDGRRTRIEVLGVESGAFRAWSEPVAFGEGWPNEVRVIGDEVHVCLDMPGREVRHAVARRGGVTIADPTDCDAFNR